MGKYFTIEEMCVSGSHPKLVEIPPEGSQIREWLQRLIKTMDKVRAKFGAPIIVTSGYRNTKLNNAVGGSATSAHRYGLACDVKAKDPSHNVDIAKAVIESGVSFDQLILEKYVMNNWVLSNAQWIHIGLSKDPKTNRREILAYDGHSYRRARYVDGKFKL